MIVITTPTGNVGSEVVHLLAKHSSTLPFRAVLRDPQKLNDRDVPSARLDFSDSSTWSTALAGVTTLFLVCPQPSPKVVREETFPFIDAAIKAGCTHIIYLSVPGADTVKAIPHYSIERYIEQTGVKYTLLRASYFMQNFIRKAPTHGVDIAVNHEIFIPAGKGRITFIDTRDIAAVVVNILEKPQRHYNKAYSLTGSESLTMYEVADTFSHVLNQQIHYNNPSLLRFWLRLRKRHVPLALLVVTIAQYMAARFGKAAEISNTVATFLGREPITLAQFVSDYKRHWLEQIWV